MENQTEQDVDLEKIADQLPKWLGSDETADKINLAEYGRQGLN